MLRDETKYLQDIAQRCEKIRWFTAGLAQSDLVTDERSYDAVVRNLGIIGEAAKHIPQSLRARLPDIEWRKAAGLRDMPAHAYFAIDNDILWNVLQNKVPQLPEAINAFLNKQQG